MALIPPKVKHEEQHAYVGSIFRLRWRPKDHQRTTCWHPGKKTNMENNVLASWEKINRVYTWLIKCYNMYLNVGISRSSIQIQLRGLNLSLPQQSI